METKESEDRRTKLVFKHLQLPETYSAYSWDDTKLAKVKQTMYEEKFKQPPSKGLVVIKGTAGPIAKQLYQQGKKIVGLDFLERSNSAFDTFVNPKAEVVFIYNVGSEVTSNYTITGQILRGLIKTYTASNTLVIVETVFSKAEMRTKYDIGVNNFINIELKDEDEAWL